MLSSRKVKCAYVSMMFIFSGGTYAWYYSNWPLDHRLCQVMINLNSVESPYSSDCRRQLVNWLFSAFVPFDAHKVLDFFNSPNNYFRNGIFFIGAVNGVQLKSLLNSLAMSQREEEVEKVAGSADKRA